MEKIAQAGVEFIGRYLQAGALVDGVVVKSVEGTPQGGPIINTSAVQRRQNG